MNTRTLQVLTLAASLVCAANVAHAGSTGHAPTRTTWIERSIPGSVSVECDAAVAVAEEADCWRQAAALAEETAEAVAATGASGAALAAAAEFPSPWTFAALGWALRQTQKEYGDMTDAATALDVCMRSKKE
jgi:hypothetical protein